MSYEKEPIWLVKSHGKVLGPFSKAEIFVFLKRKEIVILNEVAPPFKRWQYIRDLDEFSEMIEELRVLEFGINEDHTLTSTSEQTVSVTEKVPSGLVAEKTEEIFTSPNEIVIDDVDEIVSPTILAKKAKKAQFQHGVKNNLVHKEADRVSRPFKIGIIAAVLCATIFVGYNKYVKPQSIAGEKSKNSLKMAIEHYYAGDYELALPHLKKELERSPRDLKVQRLIIPLLIEFELENKRLIENILSRLSQEDRIKQEKVFTLYGLYNLKLENYSSAKKYFNEALIVNPLFWQAFANLGVISFLEKKYSEAKNHFEAALNIEVPGNTSRGEIYIMRAVSEIYFHSKERSQSLLKNAKLGLSNYLSEYSDYRQEALLMKAYVEHELQESDKAKQSILDMVNTDPLLTEEHAKDPLVSRSPIQWKSLMPWCQRLSDNYKKFIHSKTMYAVCLAQQSESEFRAKTIISSALDQDPRNSLVQAVFSYITWRTSDESKAEMIASKAVQLNTNTPYVLPHIMKAHLCQKMNNFECAIENWQAVKSLDPTSVSAFGGLSYSYLMLKKFTLFETTFHEASKYSSYYKPLLRSQVLAKERGISVKQK